MTSYWTGIVWTGDSQLMDMFPIVQLMRFRFNLLDLGKRGGFYDALVNPLFAPGGPFAL